MNPLYIIKSSCSRPLWLLLYDSINFLKGFYTDDIYPKKFKVLSLKIFNNMTFIKNKIIEHATGIDTLKKNSKEKYSYANN